MNLGEIRRAAGLTSEDADTLDYLIKVNAKYAARNGKLVDYYEADVVPPSIGIDSYPDTVRVDVHCDWPRKAVTSVSERSRFDGFVFENGQSDQSLDEVVRNNALKSAYNRHVHSELIHGCMFATVGKHDDRCIVRFHTAETSAAIWDDAAGQLGAGFVVADSRLTDWSRTEPVPVQLNMHLPGRVVVFTRRDATRWDAESKELPVGIPTMVPFTYRATGLKPFGASRIDKTVMSITDSVIRTVQNMEVASALYAAPQKYLLGLTDEQFDSMNLDKWSAYIGALLIGTRDENGEIPTIGQLSAASPQPYIDIIRNCAMRFSGATGVPLSSLGIVYDNPSSAEAIQAGREDIVIAAQDLNDSNGESLRTVALLAMAVEGNTGIDGLTDEQRSVTASFTDPSMPSVVSQADAAVKIASADDGFAKTDVFYKMLGFDESTRRQLAASRSLQSAQSLLSAFGSTTAANGRGTENETSEATS